MSQLTIIRKLDDLQRQIDNLGTREAIASLPIVIDNVSSPPTDAELDTAFGTAANLPEGFMGLVDDAGTGTTVWFVCVANSAWWYEELAKAT